jgi:hypothetical protein
VSLLEVQALEGSWEAGNTSIGKVFGLLVVLHVSLLDWATLPLESSNTVRRLL